MYVLAKGQFCGKVDVDQERFLDGLAIRHGETSVSEVIGSAGDRRSQT